MGRHLSYPRVTGSGTSGQRALTRIPFALSLDSDLVNITTPAATNHKTICHYQLWNKKSYSCYKICNGHYKDHHWEKWKKWRTESISWTIVKLCYTFRVPSWWIKRREQTFGGTVYGLRTWGIEACSWCHIHNNTPTSFHCLYLNMSTENMMIGSWNTCKPTSCCTSNMG